MTNLTWIGSNGDWGDDTNWKASGNASGVDTATFGNDGAVTVTGYALPDVVQLDGCNLTLNGSFDADPGEGAISDSCSNGSPSGLMIAALADVAVSQLTLSNTDFVVNGALLVDGGNANSLDLEGSEAFVGVNDTLAVGILQVKNGATFSGNMALGNGMGLHVDDQSTVAQGTILEAGSSQIYVSSTANGAPETVQLSDNITLSNNGTLNVSGDRGITVALTGAISGSGTLLTPGSNVAIDGTLAASGGTLNVGALSGTGTLIATAGSNLILNGTTASGLTAMFSGNGTLTIASGISQFGATIANFGAGDEVVAPVQGVTTAQFLATAPGTGVLTLLDGNKVVGQLKLFGVQAGESFNAASNASGATVVTATAGNPNSIQQGNSFYPLSGPSQPMTSQIISIAPYAQAALNELISQHPGGNNEWFLAGDTTVVGGAPSFGFDLEVVGAVTHAPIGQGFGPGANITLASGYHALIAEGSENINLLDTAVGNSLIAGNAGADILVTSCNNDTLVGATGSNTTFFASSQNAAQNVTIQGGGNDVISTNNDNAFVATSTGTSKVYLGAASDTVSSNGHDEIVCGVGSQSQIKVMAFGNAQDTVFGPKSGSITFSGGSEAATVVGGGGAVTMGGGANDGNVLWSGTSNAEYIGGKGSAIVVGGSGNLEVNGGAGAIAVWGGSGNTTINGAAGSSTYVVGQGASTVHAATGNLVWINGNAGVSVQGANGVEAFGGSAAGNNIFHAAAGSETLWGGMGNDTFIAGNSGSGESFFVSGGGQDTFDFANGAAGGLNEILGFVQGQDTISLSGYGDNVPTISVVNGSSFISLGGGSQVEVFGVTNLTSAAFHVS